MRNENTIKVLVIKPEQKPVVREIEGDLKSFQDIVGGYIEAIYPFRDNVALICNTDGKIKRLPPNRALFRDGEVVDIIVGTFIVAGLAGEDFGSLSDSLTKKYMNRFRRPEMFMRMGGKIVALPL